MTSESTEPINIRDAVNLYIRHLKTENESKAAKGKADAATDAKAKADDEPIAKVEADSADSELEAEVEADDSMAAKAEADLVDGEPESEVGADDAADAKVETEVADGEPESEVEAEVAANAKAESDADIEKKRTALHHFLRKFHSRGTLRNLSRFDIEPYAEDVNGTGTTPGATEHLLTVKGFLGYAQKDLKLIDENLSRYIRVRKTRNISGAEITPTGPEKIRLTREGHEQLENQLDRLKMERETLADDIRKARADGDVSENSPLDAAREEQGRVEARIQELNATLERAVLIDETQARESMIVEVGARVSVKAIEGGRQSDYTLVNRTEASPLDKRISDDSPMGKALLGKKVNDEVEVEAPNDKKVRYVIVNVS